MCTNQQREINFMNNKAASCLAMGHEKEAIASLRDAFDLLAVACDQGNKQHEMETDCNATQSLKEATKRMDHKRYVYPLSNKKERILSASSNSFFVYNNCFVLDDEDDENYTSIKGGESRQMAIKSAATIYNMALAYHRLALSKSSNCKSRGTWTHKATTFYKQAIGLILCDLRHDSSCTQQQHHDAAIIALAAYNNMGQICFDLLSDNDWARGCFEAFAHIIRHSLFVSESMQHDMEICSGENDRECHFFTKKDWDGLLSNLIFVEMMTACVAAAA